MGTAAIKLIHVAKRELRMDDDDYRDLLFRTAGQSSAKDLSDDGAQAVIEEMKRLGFRPKTQRNGALTGPFAPKLVALWLSAWNLGVAHNRHEHALIAFVERQTGIAHVNWVRDQRDGAAAVEALKKWIAREAHVEWPVGAEADGRANKIAVIAAQHRKLGLGETYIDNPAIRTGQLDAIIAALGKRIREAGRG